jgi:hypothetical protein
MNKLGEPSRVAPLDCPEDFEHDLRRFSPAHLPFLPNSFLLHVLDYYH